jgi:hypothetical protein
MKVIIKNNRLALEHKADSFADLSDSELEKVARQYQIGTQRVLKKPVEVTRKGRVVQEERLTYEKKPRAVLEDEIKRYISITVDIPKELWTEKQSYIWESNNVSEMNDVNDANRYKEEAGILKVLPPFEDNGDSFGTMKMLHELTESQWEWVKNYYNYNIELKKDEETGVKTKERVYVHRLMVHEWVPENDKDVERLKDMKETAAVKLSKEKHLGKEKKKDTTK